MAVIETLVAFANSKGGTVYGGVEDNGKGKGLSLGKETAAQIVNEIKFKTIRSASDSIVKIYPDRIECYIPDDYQKILQSRICWLTRISRLHVTNRLLTSVKIWESLKNIGPVSDAYWIISGKRN